MAETFFDATAAMSEAGTETLIVDLRDNPEGNSQYAHYLAYALDGWAGVERETAPVTAITRRTQPRRERFGENDLGTAAADNPADYDPERYFDGREAAEIRELLSESETSAATATDDRPTYEPDRLVVCSARTTSSGFAGVTPMATLGADVVGVSSGRHRDRSASPSNGSCPGPG